MRRVMGFIAAGVTGAALCAANPACGAATARADVPAVIARESAVPSIAPPALLAQTAVPLTPVVAVQPAPVAASVIAPRSIVRAISPNGSQPGVLWMIAIGALLCRLGARVVRAS